MEEETDSETATFLVNEDGNVVMDITQTISNMEQQQEGSVVIIAANNHQLEISSDGTLQPVHIPSANSEGCCIVTEQNSSFSSVDTSEPLNHQFVIPDTHIVDQTDFPIFECSRDEAHGALNLFTVVQNVDDPVFYSENALGPYTMEHTPIRAPDHVESNLARYPLILPKTFQDVPSVAKESVAVLPKKRKRPVQKNSSDTLPSDHPVYVLPQSCVILPTPDTTDSKHYVCDQCPQSSNQKFVQFGTLSRHYLRVHRLRLLKQATAQCREEGCEYKSWKVDDLRQHLNSAHGIPNEVQTLEFTSMEDFEEWKTNEEKSSSSKFVCRSSSDQHSKNGNGSLKLLSYSYYACHRSGKFRPKIRPEACSTAKRKNVGPSVKIDAVCTAAINVLHDKQLNRICCEYFPTHYGHDCGDAVRQHLSKQEKEWIHQLLLRGWNSDEIVKSLRSGTITGTTDRMKKVVRQDIFNVCRSRGLRNFERRDADDSRSVELWVEELRHKSSLILWNELKDPFTLVVMSDVQLDIVKQHSRILYVADMPLVLDRHYRLIALTTLVSATDAYLLAYAVVDEAGPQILQTVFTAIQNKVGTFQPEFILTPDPSMIADAWTSESFEFPAFLLPPWKIDTEWNDGLIKHVEDEGKREAVRKCLTTLLAEEDPFKFSSFFQLFTNMVAADESLLPFSRFFATSYATVAAHWPGFHHLPDCTALQQLNGELELIVRRSRAVKRLDKCIYSLEYIATNQPFHPWIEFINTRSEISTLRQKVSDQLTELAATVEQCNSLITLRTISRIINEACITPSNCK